MVDLKGIREGDKVKFRTLTKKGIQTATRTVTYIGDCSVLVSKFDNMKHFVVRQDEIQAVDKVKSW